MTTKPMRLAAAVLCPSLLLAVPVQAATVSNAVTQDRAPDAEHPAVNRQVLVPSAGEGMNALFFLASGAGPKPTVVLLHVQHLDCYVDPSLRLADLRRGQSANANVLRRFCSGRTWVLDPALPRFQGSARFVGRGA